MGGGSGLRTFTRTLAAFIVVSGAMTAAAFCQGVDFKAEQPDCQDDAVRYCGAEIPDRDKVNACLGSHYRLISRACRPFVAPADDPEE
jgi:hypothetical protein